MTRGLCISHKYRLLFLHIPRTGGTSLTQAMRDAGTFPQKEVKISDKMINEYNLSPEKKGRFVHHQQWDILDRLLTFEEWKYTRFTIVRNPWARALSTYFLCLQANKKYGLFPHIKKRKDFKEAVKHDGCIWGYQENWLYRNQKFAVNYILRTENLQEDFNRMCEGIGHPIITLPHLGKNKPQGHYRDYYDEESREIVTKKEKKVIEMFDYSF